MPSHSFARRIFSARPILCHCRTVSVTGNHKFSTARSIDDFIGDKCSSLPELFNIEPIKLHGYLQRCERTLAHDTFLSQNERTHLKMLVDLKYEWVKQMKTLSELQQIMDADPDDTELQAMARDDLMAARRGLHRMERRIVEGMFVPTIEDDMNELIMEVYAGAGGDEAALFARELLQMYTKYAVFRQWRTELQHLERTDTGGVRRASLYVAGMQAFGWLKFEGGVHRVQRVPVTEKTGRVHTSTASVAILPVPKEIHVSLNRHELTVEQCKASGPGGMNINANPTACRIVHNPTGLAVESQMHRTFLRNKKYCMRRLLAMLYERELQKRDNKINTGRRLQVKHGERHEKMRTYNFSQLRVSDHRIRRSWFQLHEILEGGEALHEILLALLDYERTERIRELLDTDENNERNVAGVL